MSEHDEVLDLRQRVGALIDERRFADALEPAAEVCRRDPGDAAAWQRYAIALKHARRWADCLDACDRAIALAPDDDHEGAQWNAGIAASALARWDRARAAWRACGIAVPDGDGPPRLALGRTPVRVAIDTAPEVVWCDRLDPCRAIIRNVPLPDADRGYGDLVLHDGEPRGTRHDGARVCPVFDELALLQPGRYGTWEVIVDCPTEAARDQILGLFDDVDGAIEDWTESIQALCEACSLGEPHEHAPAEAPAWPPRRRLAIAARDEGELRRLRRARLWWRREVVEVTRLR